MAEPPGLSKSVQSANLGNHTSYHLATAVAGSPIRTGAKSMATPAIEVTAGRSVICGFIPNPLALQRSSPRSIAAQLYVLERGCNSELVGRLPDPL